MWSAREGGMSNSYKGHLYMQAEQFREILTDLGPAFVKIGQVVTDVRTRVSSDCSGNEIIPSCAFLEDGMSTFRVHTYLRQLS